MKPASAVKIPRLNTEDIVGEKLKTKKKKRKFKRYEAGNNLKTYNKIFSLKIILSKRI